MISKQYLSDIHRQFRALRNGEVADLLRRYGVCYRLAFGVQSYQLKAIAEGLKADLPAGVTLRELAETLWNEDIRESKMLATRLFPPSEMTPAEALRWAHEAPYAEVSDQLVMNLLARLPFAQQLVADLPPYTAQMLARRMAPDDEGAGYAVCGVPVSDGPGRDDVSDEVEGLVSAQKDAPGVTAIAAPGLMASQSDTADAGSDQPERHTSAL